MLRLRFPLLLSLLTLSGLSFSAKGETQLLSHSYEKLLGTKVEIESVFGVASRSGSLPFRVSIQNSSPDERVWEIELSEGRGGRTLRTSTTHQFSVPAGGSVEHEILLPFPPSFTTNSSYRNVVVDVRSPGLGEISRGNGYQTVDGIPTIALSSRLAARSLATLDKAVRDRSSSDPRFGDSYTPEKLPENWRGYTGLDLLLIDLQSWKEIRQSQRRAILEWVRLGGGLEIFLPEEKLQGQDFSQSFADLAIDGIFHARKSDDSAKLSLGKITLRKWDGRELGTGILPDYRVQTIRSNTIEQDYGTGWNLADEFGARKFNSALIFIFLVAFAILVAPINLFFFAPPGKRHRLFITTPVISLGACLIVVVIIFIGDGLGGRGYRVAFADLQTKSDEMRLYLTQEQLSRTGVMINSGFESNQMLAIDPVNLRDSEFNNLTARSGASINYRFNHPQFVGGFFRSRSEQGFVLRAAEPTRARIQQKRAADGTNAPELVSNLPAQIQFLAFHDYAGRFWRTPGSVTIAPGSAIPLEEIELSAFRELINGRSQDFSADLFKRIRQLAIEPGRFFAWSEEAPDFFLETHDGIDWEKESALISGNVITGPESNPLTPTESQ